MYRNFVTFDLEYVCRCSRLCGMEGWLFFYRSYASSTGQLACLEVHKVNRQSRKDGGHECGQYVPEEVLHGYILLSENVPTSAQYAQAP